MLGYFIKRILLIIPTMMAVILVIFLLLAFLPGTDTRNMVTFSDAQPGAGTSFFAQYLNYCKHVFLKLDFGMDRSAGISVYNSIMWRFANTLKLTAFSLVLTFLIGIPAGIYSAMRAGKWQDNVIGTLTTVFSAVPTFCVAIGVVLLFAVKLRWFDILIRKPKDYIMPITCLALMGIAAITRITRSAMLDVMSREYMIALRSLGISRKSLILKHGLKNAFVQITSVMGSLAAQLICGAIVLERFFTLPGLGYTISLAISSRNTSLILSSAVLISFSMCILNVVLDAMYFIFNPAIRSSVSWRSPSFLRRKGGAQ